jgi:isopenicillin N synthase-like dioxygenase
MIQLVKVILKILARGLPEEWNCPPDVFDAATIEPSIPMRLLHYAPQSAENKNQFGGETPKIIANIEHIANYVHLSGRPY